MNDIEQPARPVSSAITIPRIVAIFVLLFGATALAVRCVAVASQSPHGATGHSGHSALTAGPALTVEQLGAKAGCHPKVQINAAELRQGYCPSPTGRFFLTTFTTGNGQQAWLEQAQDYGPQLVGNRWAASARLQTLQQLQGKLGGELYNHAHGGGGS